MSNSAIIFYTIVIAAMIVGTIKQVVAHILFNTKINKMSDEEFNDSIRDIFKAEMSFIKTYVLLLVTFVLMYYAAIILIAHVGK